MSPTGIARRRGGEGAVGRGRIRLLGIKLDGRSRRPNELQYGRQQQADKACCRTEAYLALGLCFFPLSSLVITPGDDRIGCGYPYESR